MKENNHGSVAVVGGGIGGLSAAALLAQSGRPVVLFERGPRVGGKMRRVEVDGRAVDAGPTVVTMRGVFERLFAALGTGLEEELVLRPAEVLHRHGWQDGARLDLFTDLDRSVEAIRELSGNEDAEGYRRFTAYAKTIFETVEVPFIQSPRPTILGLGRHFRGQGLASIGRIDFGRTMWKAISRFFRDPRLRQLFGRYATYYGSSPFQAPGTLNLIAHVEREGVWLVEGGIFGLAEALERRARAAGAEIRCEAEVAEIHVEGGRVTGLTLSSGERMATGAIVCNADVGALRQGLLGKDVRRATRAVGKRGRSLSALTWCLVARTEGFPLAFHNVFFSNDYPAEFRRILKEGALPDEPTVYICAQDRHRDDAPPEGEERLLVLVNAPPRGDYQPLPDEEIARCEERTFDLLERCGLRVHRRPSAQVLTGPKEFTNLFPATGGALYGPITHGWRASFKRPGSRSKVKGLYLAGGSVHPGAGVPMVALSGILAAEALIADQGSTTDHPSTRS